MACIQSSFLLPSVLWRCWLGGRKGIRPVKKLSGEVLAFLSVWSKVWTCIWPSWCHCHSLSLASVKSRLVLPFWYRLTRVVQEKGPLNVCVCSYFVTNVFRNQALSSESKHKGICAPSIKNVVVDDNGRCFEFSLVLWHWYFECHLSQTVFFTRTSGR